MKKLSPLLLILILAFTANQLKAQEVISLPDSISGWNYGWVAGLNGSQASYSNWSQGGVNNISVNGNSTLSGKYREGRFAYGTLLNTRYGKSRIENLGIRKTDDILSFRNRFLYDLIEKGSNWSLYGDIDFRTQFDEGFEYGEEADDPDVLISNFMSPAYFDQNAGIAYIPSDQFSLTAGVGMKQTIVTDDDLETVYGLDEGETIRNEAGFTLGASYEQALVTNFLLSSSVESFWNANGPISDTDIYFSNQLTGKINSFMNTSIRLDLVYDEDFSDEVQVLQVLSLGVSFILI
jgi:hypothetical protein